MDDSATVASYIPELGNVDPNKFGIHLTTIDNQNYCLGDSNDKFSIQSISKILALSLAFELEDDKLWDRVGVEPSGTPFNSLVQLEYEKGIPRNPLINAIMQLCGFYDEAEEFSFKVGLPGTSGVGGGILAIHPGNYSITAWGPKLNSKGNSYKGMRILEFLTTRTQSSIF
jgi:glutaminase